MNNHARIFSAHRIALLGMLLALTLVLGWVEHILPMPTSIPGIKLGLGNLAVVFALYRLGRSDALILSAAKVLLSAVLFGGISGLMYSACGAAFSYAAMLTLYKRRSVSPVGTSAAGGAAHIAGQLTAAAILTATPQIWRLCAPLLAIGTLTGALNGFIASLVLRRIDASMPNAKKNCDPYKD